MVDVDWRVDVKTASDTASQMSVPTVLMQLQLADSDTGTQQPVAFELNHDALQTLLASMGKIRSQLQQVNNANK